MKFSIKTFFTGVPIIKIDSGISYIALGNLVSGILGGLFWFIIASFFKGESYGILNYYIALASIVATTTIFGFNTTVITYLAKGNQQIRTQANIVTLMSGSAGALLLSLIVHNIVVSIVLITIVFYSMSGAELLGKKNYKELMIIMVGSKGLQIGLSLAFYFLIGIYGLLLGYALGYMVFGYRYIGSFRHFKLRFNEVRQRIRFTSHSFVIDFAQVIVITLDKLVIAPLFGFAILGTYQLGVQFLMFMGILPSSLFLYLLPQESGTANKKLLKFAGIIVSGLLAVLFFFASPWIIRTFFPNFLDSIVPTQIMSFGVIPMSIASILNSSLLGKEKSRPVFIGAITYIAIQSSLIPTLGIVFGLIGLALAMLLALIAQALYLLGNTKWSIQKIKADS